MALEGSIKEFGLADILQLIHYQRKTGSLILEGRQDKVKILFHEGQIIAAESKKHFDESRLGRLLVKKSLITDESLKNALEEQKSKGGKLGHIFLNKNLVSKEQLEEVITFQITEVITSLFSWKEGKYSFTSDGVPLDKEIRIGIDTQHLLMEGLRIVDEWSVVEGKIKLDSIFEKANKNPSELTGNEKEIYKLVDGTNDVITIADASGMENIEAAKLMLNLAENGFISERIEETAQELQAKAKKEIPESLFRAFVLAVVLISLIISIFSYAGWGIDDSQFKASGMVDALRFKIEAYKYKTGKYPLSLGEVSWDKDPWGNPFVYTVAENSYAVYSPGPDGNPGNSDDNH